MGACTSVFDEFGNGVVIADGVVEKPALRVGAIIALPRNLATA